MLTISFITTTSAFDEAREAEAISILEHIQMRLAKGHKGGSLFDINTHKIGSWSVAFPHASRARAA